MRESPQGFTLTRQSPDGLTKVEYLFSLVAGWGGANLSTHQFRYVRRNRRCKWVHKPSCVGRETPPDVLAEARERFHEMIDEMLEECG
jgi:hypothetical protein